jgi:hypothetical protein
VEPVSEARAELLTAIEHGVNAALDRQFPSLVDDLAEQVASRAAELLAERLGDSAPSSEPTLIDVAEVARRYGVSRDYVYEHSDELGVVRLGKGRNARLRFDPREVERALAADAPEPAPPSRRPRRRGKRAPLLEIGGDRT